MKDETKGTIKFIIGIICILLIVAVIVEVTDSRPSSKDKADTTPLTTIGDITTENIQQEGGEKLILPIGVEGIENAETDYLTGDIKIPRTLKVDENGIIEITEPVALLKIYETTDSSERARLKYETLLSIGVTPINVCGNEDGSITLVYDSDNLELNIQYLEQKFNEVIKSLQDNVSINNDFDEFIIYIDEETIPLEYGKDIVKMMWCMVSVQIYTGKSYDKWNLEMFTVYEKTGEVMMEYTFDGVGTFTITDEDWNAMFENLEQ